MGVRVSKTRHKDRYDYSKVTLEGMILPVVITCKKHGDFLQRPHDHCRGQGCPKCNKNPAILYYIRITTDLGIYYKIGVTNRSVKDEFSKMEVIKEIYFSTGQKAFEEEQFLLKTFLQYRYDGPPILQNGNTELFLTDVLELNS